MYVVRSPIVLSYQQEALKIQIGRCYACGDRILKKLCFVSFTFLKISDFTSFDSFM
jgi:hypothetical protein